jgi:hypothetical protein
MGTRVATTLQGLLIPDARIRDGSADQAVGAGATDSSYTESQLRPGLAIPDDAESLMTPYVSGGQDTAITVQASQAGRVGRTAELKWRPTSDVNGFRGWDPPNMVWGHDAVYWDDEAPNFAACVIPSSQKVVCIVSRTTAADTLAFVWDPAAWTWGNAITVSSSVNDVQASIVCLPESERLVCFVGTTAFFSTDEGATWATWGLQVHGAGGWTGPVRVDAVMHGGSILMFGTTTNEVYQAASADLGATFDEVASVTGGSLLTDARSALAVHPSGVALFAYIRGATVFVKRLGGAYESIADATEITIVSASSDQIALCVDPSGAVYALIHPSSSNGMGVFRSDDAGLTWTAAYNDEVEMPPGGVQRPDDTRAVSAAGGVLYLVEPDSQLFPSTIYSLTSMVMGGWSNWGASITANDRQADRSVWDHVWYPAALPSSYGSTPEWASTGTGTPSFAAGYLNLSTSSDALYYTRADSASSSIFAREAMIQGTVPASNGSLTADEIVIETVCSSGSAERGLKVRFTDTQFRAFDTVSGTAFAAATALDMTTPRQFRLRINGTTGSVFYRAPGADEWTAGPTATLTDEVGSPAAEGSTTFGTVSSSSSESNWDLVCCSDPGSLIPDDAQDADTPGKPVTAWASPVPNVGPADAWGSVGAVRGVSRYGETWDIDPIADYPIEAVHPMHTPSPRQGFRALDTSEVVLALDLANDTYDYDAYLGRVVALYIGRANMRQIVLEYSTDAATWSTAGTLDLGEAFGSVGGDLDGEALTVRSTGTDGEDYIELGSLVDGFVELANSKTRRIAWNSQGAWNTSATTIKPVLRLSGIDETETQGGQTVTIVRHSGVLVVHGLEDTRAQHWRVRIPASQPCPDAGYRVGTMALGCVRVFGQQDSWGWTRSTVGRYDQTEDSRGSLSRREAGPARDQWSRSWDPTNRANVLNGDDPDYVSAAVNEEPLAADGEVWSILRGLVREHSASMASPVVALRVVPTTTSSITDPGAFLYGYIDGTIQVDHITGDVDGVDEIVRPGRLTITEIV